MNQFNVRTVVLNNVKEAEAFMENYIHCDAKGTVMMGRKVGEDGHRRRKSSPSGMFHFKADHAFFGRRSSRSIVMFWFRKWNILRVADGGRCANETACEKNQTARFWSGNIIR